LPTGEKVGIATHNILQTVLHLSRPAFSCPAFHRLNPSSSSLVRLSTAPLSSCTSTHVVESTLAGGQHARTTVAATSTIIIITAAWPKTVAPLHVLCTAMDNNVDKGFQRRHELDPPRYVVVDLGDDPSSDQVFCLPSCQSPVVMHGLQPPRHPTVQCGQKRTGVAYSSNHR